MDMTPRERVLAAISHQEPDRVPIVLGVSNATGIKMGTYRRLKQLLGIDAPDRYLYDWPELGTAEVDEVTLERLGTDVRGVWDREPAWVLERNRNREPHSPYINSWGSGAIEHAADLVVARRFKRQGMRSWSREGADNLLALRTLAMDPEAWRAWWGDAAW